MSEEQIFRFFFDYIEQIVLIIVFNLKMNESNPFNLTQEQLDILYATENIIDNIPKYIKLMKYFIEYISNQYGINDKFIHLYHMILYNYTTHTGTYIISTNKKFRLVIDNKLDEIMEEYDRLNDDNKYLYRKIYINRV